MRKLFFCLLAFAAMLLAANFKLYLKDGNYHLVREYKVEGDRVRYYSVERSDWEEIPSSLVDLQRTESEASSRKESLERQAKEIAEEDAAARALQNEILKIPQDPGVYTLEKGQLRIFKAADVAVHNNKGRSVLKAVSPVPMIPGKATLEIPGDHSQNIITEPRPEFYIQLAQQERFGIVKLTPHSGVRIVERLSIVPVSKETIEERDNVPVFTKQLTENGLFRIWPEQPLDKGEYAVVEFTEGKLNIQVWDFRVQ